jgi:hypothetical protein
MGFDWIFGFIGTLWGLFNPDGQQYWGDGQQYWAPAGED